MNNDMEQRHKPTTKRKTNMDTDTHTQDDKYDTAATVVAVAAPQGAAEAMYTRVLILIEQYHSVVDLKRETRSPR